MERRKLVLFVREDFDIGSLKLVVGVHWLSAVDWKAFCFVLDALSVLFLGLAEPVLLPALAFERSFSLSLLSLLISVKSLHFLSVFVLIAASCFFFSLHLVFTLSLVSFMSTLALFLGPHGLHFLHLSIQFSLVKIILVLLSFAASFSLRVDILLFFEPLKLLLFESSKPVLLLFLQLFGLFLVLEPLFLALLVLFLLLSLVFALLLALLLLFALKGGFFLVELIEFVAGDVVGAACMLLLPLLLLLAHLTFQLQLLGKLLLLLEPLFLLALAKLICILGLCCLFLGVLLPFEVTSPLLLELLLLDLFRGHVSFLF